jgi:hypothetical protein
MKNIQLLKKCHKSRDKKQWFVSFSRTACQIFAQENIVTAICWGILDAILDIGLIDYFSEKSIFFYGPGIIKLHPDHSPAKNNPNKIAWIDFL